jgi:hypothetical protein
MNKIIVRLIGFDGPNIFPITMSIIGINVLGQVRRMLGIRVAYYDSNECQEVGIFLSCT